MYYILLNKDIDRQQVLSRLKEYSINAVFHYIPLHSAPAGQRLCRVHGDMKNTDRLSERLVRMPLWNDMTEEHVDKVINALTEILSSC